MEDEIKEILDYLKIENGTIGSELSYEETNTLLDYITNLQEENNSLKQMSKDTYDTSQEIMAELSQENERLNNIISEVNRVLESILFELDQTGEAEQVIEKIEYCVKELKEKE